MDFKETMSQANIASIHTWLASELEFHKIDTVIYTHHVLDIFLNSRHMDDLHLAEKEESIFAKLPGAKHRKPKQKYNKRNNSFNIGDELSLKKEMAVKCLLSAVDKKNDDVFNDEAIKKLIERLCSRLNEHNLLSENRSGSSSDEEHSIKKQRSSSLPNTQREKYQDAFPLLFAASGGGNVGVSGVNNTVWGGTAKTLFTEKPQTTQESNFKNPETENKTSTTASSQGNTRLRTSRQRRRNKLTAVREDGAAKRAQCSKTQTNKFMQKPAWHHRQQNISSSDNKSSHNHPWKHQYKFDRRGKTSGRKYSGKTQKTSQQVAVANTVNSSRNADVVWNSGTKQPLRRHDSAPVPSTYSGNMFQGEYRFEATECWQLPLQREIPLAESCEQPKLQSKWFRDPQSGFLEFEPGKKSPQNKSPNAGGLSSDEAASDEGRESASESWLWCPSPSLWEDNEASSPSVSVSRLETMYRPPGVDASPSDEAGQLWEDYKAIFTEVENDLQKCLEETDEQESDDLDENLPQQVESILNSIWAEETHFPHEFDDNNLKQSDENGNYLYQQCNYGGADNCVDPSCLSCSTVNLHLLDSSISDDLALLHKQIDLISEDLNLLCRKAEDDPPGELSRKRIWLRNSQDSDYGSPTKFLCGMRQNRVFSGLSHWEQALPRKSGKFGNLYDKSYLMDDFFADVTSTLFGSTDLQWLNWGYLYPMPDIEQLLQLQASCDGDPKDVDEEDDACYVAALVRSVIEFVTDTDEQNPLKLQVDIAIEDGVKNDDFTIPHPDDQESTFAPDSRNFQEKSIGLADCVTENDAWKTSLRIGNMWQAIAGIRPVDIVYSEKQNPSDPCTLQPSDMTHFRPIHLSEMLESENNHQANPTNNFSNTGGNYGSYTSGLSPSKHLSTSLYSDSVESQLKGIEKEIGKLLFENPSCDENSPNFEKFCPKFQKLGLDKCQQTGTFEQHIQLMDNDFQKELTGRPPKANSR